MTDQCTAAILCGGKSSRMGFDKALIQQNDELLLRKNAAALAQLFPQVALITNSRGKLESHPELGAYTIIEDHYPGQGPLGGICTALEESDLPYVFVLACDMPQPDLGRIHSMYQLREDAQVVVCQNEGRLETLFALYHRSCLPVFQQQLRENHTQIRREFSQLRVKILPLNQGEAGDCFFNLNTVDDVQKWQQGKG